MSIVDNLNIFKDKTNQFSANLIAVSKTKPIDLIMEIYNAGHKIFGENKVQELVEKHESMPKDIQWHMIGHLQRNKVKYIAPFIHLIHSIDSLKLLKEVDKEGKKNNRVIDCLLQVYIAEEETKFGFSKEELLEMIHSAEFAELQNIRIVGLMGMATNTDNEDQIRKEFKALKYLFELLKGETFDNLKMQELSMGMSGDFEIALEEGSTMARIGSSIFGSRNY
jgi:PLP dependent protein